MNTSTEFRKTLNIVRDQIFDSIRSLMEKLGGKVCFRMYHYDITDTYYTYFEVDGDGYGRELFLDTALIDARNGEIGIMLHDTEDCYEPWWDLTDMTTTDALYMLEELEQIAEFHAEHPDKPVLTEYDADFDWENY